MRSPRIFLFIAVLIGLLVAMFFYQGSVTALLHKTRLAVLGFFDRSFTYSSFRTALLELQAFQTQEFRESKGSLEDNFFRVPVYSRYPVNDKRLLIIHAGSVDGIETGMPVFVARDTLLGRVIEVRRTQSVVETIFNSDWRSSVFLGSDRVEALLRGGVAPTLDLISQDAKVQNGDLVLNTSPEFPLYTILGMVTEVQSGQNDVWQRATLALGYELENISSVLILKNFP